MASKSPDAFRTISEVAEWLNTPAHVLRFWESKFSQVKPVKRAGGRRYYRPGDMALIGGIKRLLHDDGMTIKGVQKLLREQGIKHVAGLSPPLDEELEEIVSSTPSAPVTENPDVTIPEPVKGQVLNFSAPPAEDDEGPLARPTPDPAPLPETRPAETQRSGNDTPDMFADIDSDGENLFGTEADDDAVAESAFHEDHIDTTPEPAADTSPPPSEPEPEPAEENTSGDARALPAFLKQPLSETPPTEVDNTPPPTEPATPAPEPQATSAPEEIPPAPAAPLAEPLEETEPEALAETVEAADDARPEDAPETDTAACKPTVVETPPDPADHDGDVPAGVLTLLTRRNPSDTVDSVALQQVLDRLKQHGDVMSEASRS